MKQDLQKDDVLLPGDLGIVILGSTGEKRKITKTSTDKRTGTFTMTLSPIQAYVNEGLEEFGDLPPTEDIPHEEIKPKQLTNHE